MANGESSKSMTRKFGKLESLCGKHFRRWQMEMYMVLKSLKIVYVLNTPLIEVVEEETMEHAKRRRKWEEDNDICRVYILHGLSKPSFMFMKDMILLECYGKLWN